MINTSKKILKNAIGIGASQGSVLAVLPLLSKIYSQNEFGEYGLALLVISNSMICGLLRMDLAISKSHGENDDDLERACIWVPACLGLIALIMVLGISVGFDTDAPTNLVILGTSAAYFQLVVCALNKRRELDKILAIRCGQALIFVSFALMNFGLVKSLLISYICPVVYANHILRIKPLSIRKSVSKISQNMVYARVSLPGALLDSIGCSISYAVVYNIYGPAIGAVYSQTQRIAAAPLSLIAPAISQYFLSVGTSNANCFWVRVVFKRMLQYGMIGGVLYLVFIWMFGQRIIDFMLGSDWFVSNNFIMFLGIAAVARSVISPASTLLALKNKHREALFAQVILFTFSIMIYPLASKTLSYENYVITYGMTELFIYALYAFLIKKSIGAK